MVNKKGQDLSIGTLILIVLGIIVLVLLVLGFTMGWGNLWDKINIFGGSSSLGDVVAGCRLAAANQDTYTFCEKTWKVTIEDADGKRKEDKGCKDVEHLLTDITPLNCAGTATNRCSGSVTVCNGLTEAQCGSDASAGQLGCSWNANANPKCGGDATGCVGLTEAQCGSDASAGQLGCSWS